MIILDRIDLISKRRDDVINELTEKKEILESIIPCSIVLATMTTFYEPESAEEDESIIKTIKDEFNKVHVEFARKAQGLYSDIESSFREVVEICNINPGKGNGSLLKRYIKSLEYNNLYHFNQYEKKRLDAIDCGFREYRNDVTHKSIEIYTTEEIRSLAGDGVNFSYKVSDAYENYIYNFTVLYDIALIALHICYKVHCHINK